MIIYPAIDIRHRKCVRLVQGKASEQTIYSEDPVQMAHRWEMRGAKALHLVDLDRAITGQSGNKSVIQAIVRNVKIPVQVGGGMRSFEDVQEMLDMGCARAILGTKAYEDKELLRQLVQTFGDKIVVSVDTKEGKVAVKGWTEATDLGTADFLKDLESIGVQTIVFTDISRDGMMQGPNLKMLEEVLASTQMNVIASGGVTVKEDVEKLKSLNHPKLVGVIIGKALYEGTIKLEDILC